MLTRAERKRIDEIARGRSREALRLLEGPRAVEDALRRGLAVELYVAGSLDAVRRASLEREAAAQGLAVRELGSADVDRLGRTVTPQGVLALVRDVSLPLAEVVRRAGLLLWLDGVQDPGNVGAIVRVAAAFDVAGLLVGEGSADPLGVKALRSSVGLALALPFARASGGEIRRMLEAERIETWALDRGGDDVFSVSARPERLALVVGAEGAGVSDLAREASRRRIGIPLAPGVDSLNAAVAVGIATAWIARRGP